MIYIAGSVCAIISFVLFSIYFIYKHIKNKEETKFLNLYNDLAKLKEINITCKPTGKINNSYSQGKQSYKYKTDHLNEIIVRNIKIFSDVDCEPISNYLIEIKKKLINICNGFQSQIESIIKDKKDVVENKNSDLSSVEYIFSAFASNNNDYDLTQKGVNIFDRIDSDINNLIDEIMINIINRYAHLKNKTNATINKEQSFIIWLKKYLAWQKIIPFIGSTFFSLLIALLANYISFLIFK